MGVPSGNGNGKSAAVFADVFPWISIATLECWRVSQNSNPTALGTTHSGAKNFNESSDSTTQRLRNWVPQLPLDPSGVEHSGPMDG